MAHCRIALPLHDRCVWPVHFWRRRPTISVEPTRKMNRLSGTAPRESVIGNGRSAGADGFSECEEVGVMLGIVVSIRAGQVLYLSKDWIGVDQHAYRNRLEPGAPGVDRGEVEQKIGRTQRLERYVPVVTMPDVGVRVVIGETSSQSQSVQCALQEAQSVGWIGRHFQ